MNITKLRKLLVGKKLLTTINLKPDGISRNVINNAIGRNNDIHTINSVHVLLFENYRATIFVDFDSDGYRSGPWDVAYLEHFLDQGNTLGVKNINSIVLDVKYVDGHDRQYLMITTSEYVITMGQNRSDSYYPRNFFDMKACEKYAAAFVTAERVDMSEGEDE